MQHAADSLPRPQSSNSAAHAATAGAAAASTLQQQQHRDTQAAVRYKSWQRLEPPEACSTAPRPTKARTSWPRSSNQLAPQQVASTGLQTARSAPRHGLSEPWQHCTPQETLQQTNGEPTAEQQTPAGTHARAGAEAAHDAAEAQRTEHLEAEHLEVSRQVLQLDDDLRAAQVCGVADVKHDGESAMSFSPCVARAPSVVRHLSCLHVPH